MHHIRQKFWLSFAILCAIIFLQKPVSAAQTDTTAPKTRSVLNRSNIDALAARVAESGRLRVLVQLDLEIQPEGKLRPADARSSQRAMIADAQMILQRDSEQVDGIAFLSGFETLPLVVMEVDPAGLAALQQRNDITHIIEDEPYYPSAVSQLESSTAVIGAADFHNVGFDGTGAAVAILDTGVDIQHIAFNTGRSRIVAGGCFSTQSTTYGGVYTVCPNGETSDTQLLAGADCVAKAQTLGLGLAVTDCKHGTHVAGIVGANDGAAMIGVAPDVDLIPIQVFSAFDSYRRMLSFTSDQIKGLEYVLTLADEFNIIAVNMSLGGSYNPVACDYDMRRQAILNLQSVGIATIIASGNEGFRDGVGKPSCIDEAITVGATNDDDTVAAFSNISAQIDLLAPGSGIGSTFPGNSSGSMSGTSMAAPMVAGAFALLEEHNPEMSIIDKLDLLQKSGRPVDDQRTDGTVTDMKRIDLAAALQHLAGTIELEIETNSLFFHHHTESISLIASNSSNLAAENLVISTTLPSSVFILENSISHQGSADGNTIFWKNQSLKPNETLTVTADIVIGDESDITLASAIQDSDNRRDEADITVPIRPLLACNRYESFEHGLPNYAEGWLLDNGPHGQIRTSQQFQTHGEHSIILEDTSHDGVTNLSFIELGVDMLNGDIQHLDLSWMGHGFYTHHADTGLFVSTDRGTNWSKIAALNSKGHWEQLHIDLANEIEQPADGVSLFRLQFFGDGWIDPDNQHLSSGLIIDELQFNCGHSLVWDGGGSTADWSEPLNWQPDLRPFGNDVIFDGSSPLVSEVDSDFDRPVGNLIIEPSWFGTLVQTAPLIISGDYVQKSGAVILRSDDSLKVDGGLIFEGGTLQQTKELRVAGAAFLSITDSAITQTKHSGIVLAPLEFDQPPSEFTVTMSVNQSSNSECHQAGAPLANRCITISTSAENHTKLKAKVWLNQAELTFSNSPVEDVLPEVDPAQGEGEGVPIGVDPPEVELPTVALMTLENGVWSKVQQHKPVTAEAGRYLEIDLGGSIAILIQRVERVPTAVVLSTIQSGPITKPLWFQNLYLIMALGLFLLTKAAIWSHMKTNDTYSFSITNCCRLSHSSSRSPAANCRPISPSAPNGSSENSSSCPSTRQLSNTKRPRNE